MKSVKEYKQMSTMDLWQKLKQLDEVGLEKSILAGNLEKILETRTDLMSVI